MKPTVRNNAAGFSLVELMVVVAIIGILATIAVPQINSFMARARQSEAKSNLSTLYSTQKGFFAEYSTHYAGLRTIGFSPEGNLRYRIGFESLHAVTAAILQDGHGFPGDPHEETNSEDVCAATGACQELADAQGGDISDSDLAVLTFTAVASSGNIGYNVEDRWTINENKVLLNPENGIQ
jgi:type IV pilus assembly protein PilA